MTGPGPRVLWLADAPAYGGAEVYLLRCATGLPVDPWVVVATPVPARLVSALAENGLTDRLVPTRPVRGKADLLAFAQLVRVLRRVRPDLVHVNANAPANNRFGLLAALLGLRVPVVLTLHTAVPLRSTLQRAVLRGLLSRCAGVVAVSDEISAMLEKLGVAADRLHLVRNGVPIPTEVHRPEPGPTLRIGALGRLSPQKGFDVLVEAVRRLAADGVPVSLTIGGEGPEAERLERASAGLPVVLTGEVTDVARWWPQVDVVALPSRWEGLPFVLLEAMAAGVPVVATDVGDVRRVTAGAVTLVPAEDPSALAGALRLLVDPAERARAGSRARDRAVEALTEREMLAATAAVYTGAGVPVSMSGRG